MEGDELTREGMITKLYWATWHRELGELAMDVLGPDAELADALPYELSALQRLFLFTRADTIYGGSNQVQRNIIGERALGLPREPA
jgi:alkylation response protein AidB-like acyl-CoA dehydrogenase